MMRWKTGNLLGESKNKYAASRTAKTETDQAEAREKSEKSQKNTKA